MSAVIARLSGRARALPPMARDGALAVLLWSLDLVVFSSVGTELDPSTAAGATVVGYAAIGYLALVRRRRAPLTVFGILLLHSVGAALWVPGYDPVLGLLASLFTVAALCPAAAACWALPLALAPNVVVAVHEASGLSPGKFVGALTGIVIFYSLLNGGAWGTGRWAYVSRQRAADLEFRRSVEAREALADERTRIARELHDIVAHAVTVMVLQASGARRILARDRARVEEALHQIEKLGQEAMGELRNMLMVLRADGTNELVDVEPTRQPGLADLAGLLMAVRRTGVAVRLESDPDLGEPAPGIALAAYRVVQEALTNVTKHAGPGARAIVRLLRFEGNLQVSVSDDGGGRHAHVPRTLSTGHGLLGLRERVLAADGHFTSEAVHGGGFRVTAILPFERSAAVTAPLLSGLNGPFPAGASGGET
ncbi:sensor histidine kinase [Streptomyces atriruber]|uniref:histidine kinase n=1 Tax=Streptomyces atriruber TaxID=545121 RepID=A0ABV3BF97_9ACTN